MFQWIRVEDRLPESEYVSVLVCQSRNNIIMVAQLKGNEWKTGISPMDYLDGVTHWMPLPEPPTTTKEQNHGLSRSHSITTIHFSQECIMDLLLITAIVTGIASALGIQCTQSNSPDKDSFLCGTMCVVSLVGWIFFAYLLLFQPSLFMEIIQ